MTALQLSDTDFINCMGYVVPNGVAGLAQYPDNVLTRGPRDHKELVETLMRLIEDASQKAKALQPEGNDEFRREYWLASDLIKILYYVEEKRREVSRLKQKEKI